MDNYENLHNDFDLRQENQELRLRLEEAEETLRAIRSGEIDGLVVSGSQGEQVFTLVGADHPYRMLIEQMNEGALTLAPDGTILYSNRSFSQMMKAPLHELIGSLVIDLIQPDDQFDFQVEFDSKDITAQREINLLRKDGSPLPVYLSVSPMLVEGERCLAMIVTDLSEMKERASALKLANLQLQQEIIERQRTEKALRQSEEKTANILESINDAFYALDLEWRFTYVNAEALRQFKIQDPSELIGRVLWDAIPNYSDSAYEMFHKAVAEGIPVYYEVDSQVTGRWHDVHAYPSPDGISVYFLDITEVKETQAKLQKSQQYISDILGSISDPFWVLDNQWRIAYINEEAASYLGKPPSELLGQNYHDVLPGLANSVQYERYRQVMLEKVPKHFEAMGVKNKTWYDINVYPCQDGIAIYARDISEKKQMEQKIADALELNQAILESAPIGVNTFDSSGQHIFVNDAGAKIAGGPKEAVLQRGLNFNQADSWKQTGLQDIARQVLATGIPDMKETYIKSILGREVWVNARFSKFFSSGEPHLLLISEDITERKLTEETLRQSEEKFAKAFHGIPIMMTLATVEDGRYIDANDALCSGTGYTREEIIGHTSKELRIFPDYGMRPEHIAILLKDGKIENAEADLRTKSGEIRHCVFWSQLLHIGSELCHITGMIDVTEKKRVEKEFARLDRLNLIGEMAASIGHEIRNPMTAIRGFLQMLNGKECYAQDQMFFDLMIEELDRANDIISEYLGMAKDKKIDLQAQYLDEVVKSLYPMIQADANYQEMDIRLDLCKPPMPLIDANEIRQLILNIARNGLEAMSPGGILTIGTTALENEIILFIKDQGSGLAPELKDRLGTPFLTTKETGTGLGLAVCYSIASRHNARIDYETGPEGTTFYIRFPVPVEQGILF